VEGIQARLPEELEISTHVLLPVNDFELMAGGMDFKILFPLVIRVYTQTPGSVRGLRDTVEAALSRPSFHHWLKEELFDELLKESDSVAVRRAFGAAVGPVEDDLEVRASLTGVCDIPRR